MAAHNDWQAVLDRGDRDAFHDLAELHTEALTAAARHDLDYYAEQGDLHPDDLTPEEVTGETLLYAWEHRAQRPPQMSLIGWLQGTQHRVLRGLVAAQEQYRADKAISLDEPLPPEADAARQQEGFQYTYQGAQPEAQLTWEDVTPGQQPVGIEAPLFTNADTFALDPDTRHVVMMHDEFEMDLNEVAFAMNQSVKETAALLEQARTMLRERQIAAPPTEPPEDAPAPPDEET